MGRYKIYFGMQHFGGELIFLVSFKYKVHQKTITSIVPLFVSKSACTKFYVCNSMLNV